MKRIFYLLALLLTSTTAWAEVRYDYDVENQILTIWGDGEIDDVIYFLGPADPQELQHVIINDGITGIGDRVFSNCRNLSSVTIPNSVTYIGASAFSGCTSLSSFTIPNSVTSIGESAFSGCISLSSVIIGSGVRTIGDEAFGALGPVGCTAYVLPSSPPTLGEYAVREIQQFYVHGDEYFTTEGWINLPIVGVLSSVTFGEGITAIETPAVSEGNTKYYTLDVGELTLSGGAYYIVFNDEDGSDVTADLLDGSTLYLPAYDITVIIPHFHSATFAQGSGTEDGWTIDGSADGATPYEGKTVTVTYSGPHKVKSVTVKRRYNTLAELKAAVTAADASTLAELRKDYAGKVICSSGHLHPAKTAVPEGCTAIAVLGYIDGGNCYAIALEDMSSTFTWGTITFSGDRANRNCHLPGTTWEVAAPKGASWVVATKAIYEGIFQGLGATVKGYEYTFDATSNAFITEGVGGTKLAGSYWSTTQYGGGNGYFFFSGGWYNRSTSDSFNVRPVLVY